MRRTPYITDHWLWEPRFGTVMHRCPCWRMRILKRKRRERNGEPFMMGDR